MNSETRATKSKGFMFTKVLDAKLRRKYFSSFNSPNKLQYSSFANDNLNDDDVQRHSSKSFEVPLKNERHPIAVTATVRKLNRKYPSSHSHSFDSSKKFHTLITDYRRHTSTPYSEDRMRIIKGRVYTIFEL